MLPSVDYQPDALEVGLIISLCLIVQTTAKTIAVILTLSFIHKHEVIVPILSLPMLTITARP